MVKIFEGSQSGSNCRIAIVVSRFNELFTRRLLDACCDELKRSGVKDKNMTVVWVPGAFEIPLAVQKIAQRKTIDAVICLGALIRGETKHYDLVAEESARGIMNVSLITEKPVIFEVLVADTVALIEARAKVKGINKGRDAARAAVEMATLCRKI